LLDQAVEHHRAGRLGDAERLYREILAQDSRHADALHLLGLIAHQVARHDIAVELIGQAIAVNPNVAAYHANQAAALMKLGRTAESLTASDAALRISPDYLDAWYNRGLALHELGRLDDALAAYDGLIAIKPDHAQARASRGTVLYALGRLDEALAAYDAALAIEPNHASALSNRGIVLYLQGRAEDALASYDAALCLVPSHADTLSNRGPALCDLGRHAEAMASYEAAIRIRPDHAQAHYNSGTAFYELGHVGEARAAFEAALRLKPDYVEVASQLIHCLQSLCDWDGLDQRHRELLRRLPASDEKIPQFPLLSYDLSAAQLFDAARKYAKHLGGSAAPPPNDNAKIRIGYLSSDFRIHPTSYLMAELIERHDRQDFEIIGYSYGPDDGSPIRQRLIDGFDRFVDIRATTYAEAARIIRRDRIDILVDLNGYTRIARPQILAHRPAPVQVNFLGYPGTMGADFIDYVIADAICIPPGDEAHFSEKIIRLPDCYQPNDRRREIAAETPSREAAGLPARGFVFCCFNNSFKITPATFGIWMRLLAQVPDSVLWLLDGLGTENLRREAVKAGIGPNRLVFAPKAPLPEHLARHRLADLFLDTLPYNAHTTTSDALWAGLPVLTCLGKTFAGRVAASLLTAVGLPELITRSPKEYEAMALALAGDPARLADLKRKLADNRDTAPLFDTDRFARNLEDAYRRIAQ